MKCFYILFILFILSIVCILLFTGCSYPPKTNNTDNPSETSLELSSTITEENGFQAPPRNDGISFYSLEELERLNILLTCKNSEELEENLKGLIHGGQWNPQKIDALATKLESLPYVTLIDGEITWIDYTNGVTPADESPLEEIYVAITAENGDWVRLNYLFSVKDVDAKIEQKITKKGATSLITVPMHNQDNRIILYTETREKHPVEAGTVIEWIAKIDGMYVEIVYYTADASSVVTSALLDEAEVSTIFTRVLTE